MSGWVSRKKGSRLVLSVAALLMLGGAPGSTASDSKLRIGFAGDSIVDNYWSGTSRLVSANPCLKGVIELGRYARNGTGVTRGDKLYWPRHILKIADEFKPQIFVISIGMNDRQFIVDASGQRTAWGAPNWLDKYKSELTDFVKAAADGGRVVLLLGLPAMREAVDDADAREKNQLFAEVVASLNNPRVRYVEPWKLAASGIDTFSTYGRDRNDRLVQIRAGDGKHFTSAGEELLASHVFPKLASAASENGLKIGEACREASAAK